MTRFEMDVDEILARVVPQGPTTTGFTCASSGGFLSSEFSQR
jgi:hypothetical protein